MQENQEHRASRSPKIDCEEVYYLNKAISDCQKLNADLQASLLKVRVLHAKFNTYGVNHTPIRFIDAIQDVAAKRLPRANFRNHSTRKALPSRLVPCKRFNKFTNQITI